MDRKPEEIPDYVAQAKTAIGEFERLTIRQRSPDSQP
jgi:hypothetical protein